MFNDSIILNEREASEKRKLASDIDQALSTEEIFASLARGLPYQVSESYRRALSVEKNELEKILTSYETTKDGDDELLSRSGIYNPGIALIIARIANQMTQKELARHLGLKEQQIQRYEADRYNTISLSRFQKIARVLGLEWTFKINEWRVGGGWNLVDNISPQTRRKIVRHAKTNGWFESNDQIQSEKENEEDLIRRVFDHVIEYSTPSLLRTGLSVEHLGDDFKLLAWKARVSAMAEEVITEFKPRYNALDISWLPDLVNLSIYDDGPSKARNFLLEHGIVLVAERHIEGMKVDGAAFMVGKTPVIGLTLRRDTIDNFWFTLLHEVAHVILHYRTGLSAGFFDNMDKPEIEAVEQEADEFASNLLIPDEKWMGSPARIAKSAKVIEKFAERLGIHSAVVFGRIQKERKNYSVFANKLGRGQVRKQLLMNRKGEN